MTEEDFSKYNGEGTQLRKVQLRILDIMVAIDKVCRDNDIKYWLDYGSLLGAVRHKGFIPWDTRYVRPASGYRVRNHR